MRTTGILRAAFDAATRLARQQGQSAASLPLTGLFAVNKPSGITSTTIVDLVQHVAKRNQSHPLVKHALELDGSKRAKRGLVKVGHGGTLDPMARGIVVIGMGAGCKKLHGMSGSSKVYIAEARLGFATTTLDAEGSLVAQEETDHVTKDRLIKVLNSLTGEISQTPPLYSALSMEGKRLYDYAREGIPLPREIPVRKVQIHELELLSYPDGATIPDPRLQHYGFRIGRESATMDDMPPPRTTPSSPPSFDFLQSFEPKRMAHTPESDPDHVPIPLTPKGVVFHIRIHCSSGTYIRTLIDDIATRLGTVGHMTDLLREEQSGFKLGGEATLEMNQCADLDMVDRAIQAGYRLEVSPETCP